MIILKKGRKEVCIEYQKKREKSRGKRVGDKESREDRYLEWGKEKRKKGEQTFRLTKKKSELNLFHKG